MKRKDIGSSFARLVSQCGLSSVLLLGGCTSDKQSGPGYTPPPAAGASGTSTAAAGAGTGGTAMVTGGSSGMATGGSAGAATGGTGGSGGEENLDPMLLSETGLYADLATSEDLAEGVMPYEPTYWLWTDSADKHRWAYIPPGTQITTTDMNFWQFPVGTKFWKEFDRDGVRVETRLLWKQVAGAAGWYMMAFKWNADQTDAVATPEGELNASGTQHDIPSKEQCSTCHRNMRDRGIGFSAIQLSHGAEVPGVNLQTLIDMGMLSAPPAGPFTLPGNAVDQQAMGYLHANCGMCHNYRANVYNTKVAMDLWLEVEQLGTVKGTQMYLDTADQDTVKGNILGATKRLTPGDLANSAIFQVMSVRDVVPGQTGADAGADGGSVVAVQMPPLGTELTDPDGLAKIQAWIEQLPNE